jgi:hypothetical protein
LEDFPMNDITHKSESGQAIVYLVIGLVVFLGFVALAIDGGMALADRRHDQNAADSASLAGGGKVALDLESAYVNRKNWNCSNLGFAMDNGEYFAITRAANNNFTISDDTSSGHNYVDATCSNGSKYIDVTVEISATTPSNFLQLVFPNALHNEVDAVTRVHPRHPVSPGNAIIALNSAECNGNQNGDVFFINPLDDTTLRVNNGSIFSNGCIKCNGQPNIIVDCDYAADPNCNPDALGSFGNDPETCNGTWTPPPESPVEQIDPEDFTAFKPDCSDPAAHVYTGNWFSNHLLKPNKLYTMASGLWCLTGNVTINSNNILKGDNVTIVVINGDFTINGTAEINLTASTDTHASPEIPGVLIYVPAPDPFNPSQCTNHTVKLDGTSTSTFFGSIVAPCSKVTLTGTGGNTYMGQIVGWNVDVGGDATLNLTYNENLAASSPTSMELHK